MISPQNSSQAPSKADLLKKLLAKRGVASGVSTFKKRATSDKAQLSYAQQRLWFMQQMQPDSPAYNLFQSWDMLGDLDVARLERAFQAIIQRHEIFRTQFSTTGDSTEVSINSTVTFNIQYQDASALEAAEQSAAIESIKQSIFLKPFSLTDCPLLRVSVLKTGPLAHKLFVCVHHIIFDGWSISILMDELSGLYQNDSNINLPALEYNYYDYALTQRERIASKALNEQKAYWIKQLDGIQPIDFPIDKPRPSVLSQEGAGIRFDLPAPLLTQLKQLARDQDCTLFTLLLSAWKVLVHRYSGSDDIAIGSPVAGRQQSEWESVIGFFTNMLVLRSDLSDSPSFSQLLSSVKKTTEAALNNQDYPFEVLVETLQPERHLTQNPLFQIAFSFQNLPQAEINLGSVQLEAEPSSITSAKFDLLLALEENDAQLQGLIEYSSDLFHEATIQRLIENFKVLLSNICVNAKQNINQLELLSDAEIALLKSQPLPIVSEPTVCIHQLFEARAREFPQNVAITCESEHITYAELNEQADAIAQKLYRAGVKANTLVGVCLERSPQTLIAILAILKAGGAYLPLDPNYPQERLNFIIEDSATKLIISSSSVGLALARRRETSSSTQPVAASRKHEPYEVIFIEDLLTDEPQKAQLDIPPASPYDLAYVIYTSGSTGKPKGVLIPHSNVTRLFEQTAHWFNFDSTDIWSLFHSFSFDFSVWEIWGALAYGGRIVLVPYWVSRSSDDFLRLLIEEKVTVLSQTPSAFRQLTQQVISEPVAPALSLKWVIFGGEALDLPDLKPWFQTYPTTGPKLINMYGITETTVHVTYREITASDVEANVGSVIGEPIPDLSMYILDKALQPVPYGVVGEIYVGGAGLAQGYLNRPELTDERFIQNKTLGRLYKTGDLARFLNNGDIEYRGRSDFQVQLKGFRIELGEVQAALMDHSEVTQAAVIALDDTQGNPALCAYIVAKATDSIDATTLRTFLASRLPEYMVPPHFIFLEALPLTANNKLDRQALPTPNQGVDPSKQDYRPATNKQEAVLQEICCEVLGIDQIGIEDNLFTLGADSIRTLQIRAKTRQRGYEFELQDAFRYQTITTLAPNLRATTEPASTPGIAPFALVPEVDRVKIPQTIADAYPLSALQSGMLFHSELNPDSAIYHDIFSYRLQAPYDPDKLSAVLESMMERHPILRTSFQRDGLAQPLQYVHAQCPVPLTYESLSSLPDPVQRAVIQTWIAQEKDRLYDWSQPPLFRVATHQLNETQWQFSLSLHHSILDGWSVSALLAELFERYLAALGLHDAYDTKPLTSTFSQFIDLERNCIQSTDTEEFWKKTLDEANALPLPRWPELRQASPQKRHVRDIDHLLSKTFTDKLNTIAARAQTPLKTVLLAAHIKVMGVLGNQSDIITGLISNGRPEENDAEKVLGLFLNTVPIRLQIREESWLDLIQNTFAAEQTVMPHRRYPLAEIQRLCGKRDLCETAFNYVHFHVLDTVLASPHIDLLESTYFDENNFALFAQFSLDPQAEQLTIHVKYDATVFTPEQMEAIHGYYVKALEAIVDNTEANHCSWNPLSTQEQTKLLNDFKGDALNHDGSVCLHQLLEKQTLLTPTADALIWQEETWSYAELNQAADKVTQQLTAKGVTLESRVGLYLQRSPKLIVAMLAILKAGGTYVPLDPAYPQERLSFLFDDAAMELIITEQALSHALPADALSTAHIEDILSASEVDASERLKPDAFPQNLAYIIYTSGSTGKPKGTAITHANAVAMVHWAQSVYSHEETAGMLTSTSVCFDLSVYEIFLTLAQGGTLILADNALELTSLKAAHRVTLINTVPSAMAELVRSHSVPESVRTVNLAGEPLKASLADAIYELPHVEKVYDLYGPSEDTTYSTFTQRIAGGYETIGRPVANTHLYLLDAHLNPVPLGAAGEIFLSGEGITRGYYARPDLTASRYIPDPFSKTAGTRMYQTGDLARWRPDGHLEFLGRLDHQVKIRGYRIELGEIQTALEALPHIKEAVVIAHANNEGHKLLIAYVVTTGDESSAETLRDILRKALPEYMVPAAYVFLEALPRTPNGKLDRHVLPEPQITAAHQNTDHTPARNELEAQLIRIWQDVLGIDAVGIHDNFFALGGDSILMIQIVGRAREQGLQLTTRNLYEHETIAELSPIVGKSDKTEVKTIAPTGEFPLTPIQHWFFEQNLAHPNHWNQSILLTVEQPLEDALFLETVHTILQQHDVLRASFKMDTGNIRGNISEHSVDTSVAYIQELDDKSALEAACNQLQSNLNIESGRLAQFAYFQCPEQDYLFIVIHHLAVDGVSWRILLPHLSETYAQLEAGKRPSLPAKTTSWRAWALALSESAQAAPDFEYWRNQSFIQTPLPTDHASFANTHAEEARHELRLSQAETTALLRDTQQAYNTQINDILLAALTLTLKDWTQQTAFTLHLEGHGRETVDERIDISNTLGWFTTLYPVTLSIQPEIDLGALIRTTKETLRAIPSKGQSYGLLRYLRKEATIEVSNAQISFNYLGQTASLTHEGQRFQPSAEPRGRDWAPENKRAHLIDISAIILDDCLQIDWRYPAGAYEQTTIANLNASYVAHLKRIIAHCTASEETHYTPSDFSLNEIDQSDLDDALDEIEF